MKIIIDARFWGPSHTGLGVYTRELVENLAKLDSSNEYVILLRKEIAGRTKWPRNFSETVVDVKPYSFAEQIILPNILYKLKADLVHFPSINVPIFYFGHYIVTIHDLIKHHSRGPATTTHSPFLYWIKYLTYLFVTNIIVNRSKKIIVPSQQVKKEILENFKVTSDKIVVTYEAPTLSREKKADPKVNLPVKFAIYTGNAYPHKNLEKLISVWPKVFAKTKMELVISSGRDVFSSKIAKIIEKYSSQKFVHYLGFLSDQQLSYAYSQATLYIFPTLLEGFGIPGLDAMNFGLPVVCSNIPVLREVYADAAEYFDPKNPTDMQEKIIEVASNKDIRQKLIKSGLEQVKKYSWQKMTRDTLKVYESVVLGE